MGVRRLRKFIEKKQYKVFPSDVNIIGIDILLYLHKYIFSDKCQPLYNLFNMISKFLSQGIIPLFIFDGKPISEKNEELAKRFMKKNKIKLKVEILKEKLKNSPNDENIKKQLNKMLRKFSSINSKLIKNCKILMNLMKVPYIEAKTEADFTCCRLYLDGIIDGCLTEDMDFLLLGCDRNFHFEKGQIIEYNLQNSLNKLELSFSQFQDFCLLLGCDYVKKFILNDGESILNSLKSYGSIKNWIKNTIDKDKKTNLLKCLQIKDVLNFAIDNENLEIETYKLVYNNDIIKISELQEFFSNNISPDSRQYHLTNTFAEFIEKVNAYKFLNGYS